jgi:hypothetical protein
MQCAGIAWALRGRLSIGGNEILGLGTHRRHGTILDILRADQTMSSRFVVNSDLLGFGALPLHRYDLRRVLVSIVFGWFLLGRLLRGCGGDHL